MSRKLTTLGFGLPIGMLLLVSPALAAAVEGQLAKQATNWVAIGMFFVFVLGTLGITYWAARRTTSRAQFYTAGGGITGFQNGLAIAGDYMSAASFLGISALVYSSGYDGLIYSIGFLVGWPLIMFLMAERLRNLGRYTFADVVSYRLSQNPIRVLRRLGHADGRGVLPDRTNGRRRSAHQAAVRPRLHVRRHHRRHPDDGLRHVRRHARHHLGADHQGRAAARRRELHRLHGAVRVRLQCRGAVRQGGGGVAEAQRDHGGPAHW